MRAHLDGLVCLDRLRQRYGFIVFRTPDGGPVEYHCGQWAWPATDDGRAEARRQMVRVIDRASLEAVQMGAQLLRVA